MKIQVETKGQIVLYRNRFEVRLDKDTVWLTQKQMAELFNKGISTINEHIRNIYKENELEKHATIRKFRIVQKEGKRQIERDIEFYNLDIIISLGYRVKSKQGTQFRIWATNVLKKYLIDGYTINEKRLKMFERKYLELQKSLKLLGNVISLENISDETRGLFTVINQYSRALDILDDYDNGCLSVPKGTKEIKYTLDSENARLIIDEMRIKFKSSSFFGQKKDKSFESSLRTIYQTFDGKDVYPTIEEKAANLLYFIVKNHSFVDGNKRIAAALFICFLQKNRILFSKDGSSHIDNNSLVALTLMIATSKTSEKDVMIKVILNLLK
ncbi:MAG: virulence protein RhuM/Fic/DOC family protein [Elusimicrobia bacterium]|nr:virulence protein RhuM/Fic/DOC family protein [Elusimicrobiota bacterium]